MFERQHTSPKVRNKVTSVPSRQVPCKILNEMFQSLIDLVVSVILLTSTLTVTDTHSLYNDGILGEIECRLWNTQMFLWGFLTSSTWNMVSLTFERYIFTNFSCAARLESPYSLIWEGGADDLVTWWKVAFSTFVISIHNLQYSDWIKLRIWKRVRGRRHSSFSM